MRLPNPLRAARRWWTGRRRSLPNPVRAARRSLRDRKRRRVRDKIHARLNEVYEKNALTLGIDRDTDRIIIFSDQHKGARDGADDFQRCERAYNAALAYYHHLGYHLVVLGDVEELWENSFQEIAGKYPRTFELEAAFHSGGRYTRIWGNHDIAWKDNELFQQLMSARGLPGVAPIEGLKLEWSDGASTGELFLVHGHQGTADSERYARLSQFFVRHGWRRLQRRLNRPWNTPSVDWSLRGEHALAMSEWAAANGRVLIAGHTHLPVFFNERKQPATTPEDAASDPDPEREALRLARYEWATAELERLKHQKPIDLETPCYFNTGCCSFGDGDITGLEISGGMIQLVRWPCRPETAPEHPAGLELQDVMAKTGRHT